MNDITEINGRLDALVGQRNQLADQVAFLHGKLALAAARIKELEEQLKKREDPHGDGSPAT